LFSEVSYHEFPYSTVNRSRGSSHQPDSFSRFDRTPTCDRHGRTHSRQLCCLVHAIHCGRSSAYLTDTVQSVGASRSRSGLRSSSTSSTDYSPPRLRTKFGERAFSHAGPATWNALPDHIRTVADPVKFRQEAQLSPRDRAMRRVN